MALPISTASIPLFMFLIVKHIYLHCFKFKMQKKNINKRKQKSSMSPTPEIPHLTCCVFLLHFLLFIWKIWTVTRDILYIQLCVYKASTQSSVQTGIRANIWATWRVTFRSFNHSRGPDIPLTLSGMYEILDSTLMSRNALKSILFLSWFLSRGPRVQNNVKVHMDIFNVWNQHIKHRSAFENKTNNL